MRSRYYGSAAIARATGWPSSRVLLARVLGLLLVAATAACSVGGDDPSTTRTTTRAASSSGCDLYASPRGADEGDGTASSPFRSVQKLADELAAGETGCLRNGVYVGETIVHRDGIVLTSAPGERAHVRGKFEISDDADDVTVTRLLLDGRGGESYAVIINGDRAILGLNEIRNDGNRGCVILGNLHFGRAIDVTIEQNRIHDCGFDAPEPERRGHGIYVAYTLRTRIQDNYIYDAILRGIQLYPHAQETKIHHNVIDGNGVGIIISGGLGHVSSNTSVTRNVVTNSRARYNIEGFWPEDRVGENNVVEENCVWNGNFGNIEDDEGYVARNNVIADPLFYDRDRKDFRVRDGSPCVDFGPRRTPA